MYQKLLLETHPSLLEQRFFTTDIGQLYCSIPFEELANQIPPPKGEVSGLGRKAWFDVKGGIALQVLKHYLQLSDEKLIERINTDWVLQMFCGIQLKPGEGIRDKDQVGSWRSYLGQHMDIKKWQKTLARSWKPFMQQTQSGSLDATCYESRIAFPTDVKLIWQGCHDLHLLIQSTRKRYKQRKSRNNYAGRKKEFTDYQKRRKKTRRQEKKLRKRLLKYLCRLVQLFDELCGKHDHVLSGKQSKRVQTIITVYEQQHQKAYGDQKIKNRIVSISKPYVRAIVRGKETKTVEFGAKVNKLQVDGINFIEHLNYNAFNEGVRLEHGVRLQEDLFGKCGQMSADAIFATNSNRKYCRRKTIVTNFVPKGRQKTQHIQQAALMRSLLNKERTTRLEGSFGNEKNHYLLDKVNARNQTTERCWIFFGIHTANAVAIAKRIAAAIATPTQNPPPQRSLPFAA